MLYIIVGCIGFMLFILYDLNLIRFKIKLFHPLFAMGFFLVAVSTIVIARGEGAGFMPLPFIKILAGILALMSFLFLIYSLFFALPFKQTYITITNRQVYDQGIYALCRHPGVIWFMTLYFSLWIFTGLTAMFWTFVWFSLLNLLYSFLQDRYFFPEMFNDYERYRKTTPFLLPTGTSIRRCLTSIRIR